MYVATQESVPRPITMTSFFQSRGGCSCAGPYGHRLLGIDLTTSRAFEREIVKGCEGIKPGWVRVNFNYFISEEVFQFIVDAVHFVATHGCSTARRASVAAFASAKRCVGSRQTHSVNQSSKPSGIRSATP